MSRTTIAKYTKFTQSTNGTFLTYPPVVQSLVDSNWRAASSVRLMRNAFCFRKHETHRSQPFRFAKKKKHSTILPFDLNSENTYPGSCGRDAAPCRPSRSARWRHDRAHSSKRWLWRSFEILCKHLRFWNCNRRRYSTHTVGSRRRAKCVGGKWTYYSRTSSGTSTSHLKNVFLSMGGWVLMSRVRSTLTISVNVVPSVYSTTINAPRDICVNKKKINRIKFWFETKYNIKCGYILNGSPWLLPATSRIPPWRWTVWTLRFPCRWEVARAERGHREAAGGLGRTGTWTLFANCKKTVKLVES